MSDLLQTIQEQIAKEYFKYQDISWVVLTEDAQLRLWPEVCKRYAFEVAKASLKEASEKAKVEQIPVYMGGLSNIDKSTILDESNIKL